MRGRSCAALFSITALILASGLAPGQSARPDFQSEFGLHLPRGTPPGTIMPTRTAPPILGLPQIARAAGIIFSGTVTNVSYRPANAREPVETVAITFHVENALRGAIPGDLLTITEWAALWSGGQHYRAGERVLLFLYPPSKLGLTSSVGGPLGRFRFDAQDRILFSAQQVSAFRTDSVLGGKSRIGFSDFALAVRQARWEE